MTATPETMLALVQRRTGALLAELADLDDTAVREATRLPDWTRGHLLTHLARNGDAMLNAFHWASTGEKTPMYASREARAADIQAGSGRSAKALVQDVRSSARRWQDAASAMPDEAWTNTWQRGSDTRDLPGSTIPLMRLGEIELHWFDLDLPTSPNKPDQWPAAWVAELLPDASADLAERAGEPVGLRCADTGWSVAADSPGRTIVGTQAALLAWVTGRTEGTDLVCEPVGDLPDLGPWR